MGLVAPEHRKMVPSNACSFPDPSGFGVHLVGTFVILLTEFLVGILFQFHRFLGLLEQRIYTLSSLIESLPNVRTPPINSAIAAGSAKVCLELLNRNCDVQWRHSDGASALHVATAWIASSHNAQLRMPPTGEQPRAVIAMMLHNGVDPTLTEGMSMQESGAQRGFTPLEAFKREVAQSPWRMDPNIGQRFDQTAQSVYALLEQAEKAVKLKQDANKKFSEKDYEGANKMYTEARRIWEAASIRGHHLAVLWSNQAH